MIWLILLFVIVLPFAVTGWLFAPWVPIDKKDLERLGKFLKLKKTDIFYELGCGDGRVVDYVARTFGCKSVGIELNPFLYFLCLFKKGNYIFGDLSQQNLSEATCVYVFGLPRALNNRVVAKLKKELKKESLVVSYGFKINSLKLVKTDTKKGKLPIFLYKI